MPATEADNDSRNFEYVTYRLRGNLIARAKASPAAVRLRPTANGCPDISTGTRISRNYRRLIEQGVRARK